MANVTDSVFRKIITKYGKPDVMWTEFVSADGLMSAGREILLQDLKFIKEERPIVAQLFTGHPEVMKKAARLVAELGFDGLDINMGCPDRAVEKQGGGADHIRNPENAVKVILAAREGWGETAERRTQKGERASQKVGGDDSLLHSTYSVLPVSVKTRIGYNRVEMDWLKTLLELKLPALTVHLRTRKEMSDVPAHWELMPEIIKLRNEVSPETLIIGNGDVYSMEDAVEKTKKYGCDGVMIGRGIFGTPWLFESTKEKGKGKKEEKTPKERLIILLEHTKLFEKTFKSNKGENRIKNFAVMKKHFKAYVSGFDGAKELRVKLMETENAGQVAKVVKEYLSTSHNSI